MIIRVAQVGEIPSYLYSDITAENAHNLHGKKNYESYLRKIDILER